MLCVAVALLVPHAPVYADDHSDEARTHILPWAQSAGQLFGLTDEGLDSLRWDDAYLTACPRAELLRMQAVVNNPAYYNYTSGPYRLHSDRGGYLCMDTGSLKTSTAASYATALSSVVWIERTADGGCYLKMQGRYLHTPQKDRSVALDDIPEKFYPVVQAPGGKVAFTTHKGSYSALHCGYSNVIGYTLDDDASFWTPAVADQFTVTASVNRDGTYYHTLFAPFATTTKQGTQAFVLAEYDGKAVATDQLTTVPARQPVLLRADSRTMQLGIDADADAPAPRNTALRNRVADLSYSAFNRAFLLYSGEGNDNHTYYRENLATKDKLYFWQQALVILMVEDRHDCRGDRAVASLVADLLDAFSAHEGGNGDGSAESSDAHQRGLSDWTWNKYNDDLLWAGLAYVRGYLITRQQRFLDQAEWAWQLMYNRGWDTQLGGGIWWSTDKQEKSGLSNNPAVCMACYLYDATGDPQYLEKAKAIYAWVRTKLRNTDGSVDEKIRADGTRPNSYNVYNQGTFVEGAANLCRLTGETRYRTDARKTIEYVMVNCVTSKGIMSRWKTDGTWQSELARGMAAHLRANPEDWNLRGYYKSTRSRITYYDWMRLNADAAWDTRDRVNDITGCKWEEETPTYPSEGRTWECDACASAVVMTNVTPEVLPGSPEETCVDLDDHSADYAYIPSQEEEPTPDDPPFVLDDQGIMRVGAPIKIACVGNSITEGYGNSTPYMAWPAQLERQLGGNYAVGNYGKSGYCLGRNTDYSYWTTSNFEAAKAANPDILVIALGTNDADPRRWDVTGPEFRQDYLDMIAGFRADGRSPVIFCTLPPPVFPVASSTQNRYIEEKLIPVVTDVAREANAYVLDFHTPMTAHADAFPDNVHPDDQGAALLAQIARECISGTQFLQGSVAVNGTVAASTHAVTPSGGNVTLSPVAGRDGTWAWTGPNNYTSTGREVTLTNVQSGGTYTVRFTDSEGQAAVLTFLVSVQGQTGGTIKPYVKTTEGQWQQTTDLTVQPGQDITFGPQYSASGTVSWAWRGPNGFLATARETTVTAMNEAKAGAYGVTVTDAQGRQTTAVYNIRVEGELDCAELIPYVNTGSWENTTAAAVAAGASVTFGPQPFDGEWTWTGPAGFTYKGREARVSSFSAAKAGEYVATRTTEAGCYDQIVFTLTLKQ